MSDDLKLPELLIDGQKIDGRTAIARRYRDQLAGLNIQLGGSCSATIILSGWRQLS
ncbi:MAG: hypothetical protein Q8M21_13970 [Methylococcaceae bacterium]|nr:hypothetical protein [Methylococcaceae bacterium]